MVPVLLLSFLELAGRTGYFNLKVKYRKLPKISPSKYKSPPSPQTKPVTQNSLR